VYAGSPHAWVEGNATARIYEEQKRNSWQCLADEVTRICSALNVEVDNHTSVHKGVTRSCGLLKVNLVIHFGYCLAFSKTDS
jgi:hypothetical protein